MYSATLAESSPPGYLSGDSTDARSASVPQEATGSRGNFAGTNRPRGVATPSQSLCILVFSYYLRSCGDKKTRANDILVHRYRIKRIKIWSNPAVIICWILINCHMRKNSNFNAYIITEMNDKRSFFALLNIFNTLILNLYWIFLNYINNIIYNYM